MPDIAYSNKMKLENGGAMSESLGNDVMEFTGEYKKISSDIQFGLDEFKDDVQNSLEEFRDAHASQREHIQSIEQKIFAEMHQLKNQIHELQQKLDALTADTPQQLREELINGIRMLGERVSNAIAEMNQRLENLANEMTAKASPATPAQNLSEGESNEAEFASLKESDLFEKVDFEIVPNKAIQRLTELFKKQSEVVRKFVEKHEQKIFEFDYLLRTYDEENTRLLELLDKRVNRNFRISTIAIILVLALIVILKIIS